jgi:hypothetical protein
MNTYPTPTLNKEACRATGTAAADLLLAAQITASLLAEVERLAAIPATSLLDQVLVDLLPAGLIGVLSRVVSHRINHDRLNLPQAPLVDL